jgi:lipoprotein-anchoring transpeptidase ErfK/SrfK
VDVNLSTQTLTAYEGDEAVMTSRVSSGTWDHPTVTGQFRIYVRFRSQTMDGRRLGYDYYLENVPYVMYFYEDYALHGTYWHNNFGTPMSHGCVNMKTPDAGWLFEWTGIGTLVNVHY